MSQSRPRFAQIPEWAFLHESMQKPQSTLHVYTALCILANYRERVGDIDWQTLAEYTGLKRTVVFGALRSLRDAGIIVKMRNGSYHLPMDEKSGLADDEFGSTDSESVSADSSLYTENYSEGRTSSKTYKPKNPEAVEMTRYFQTALGEYLGKLPKIGNNWVKDMDLLLRCGSIAWAEPEPIPSSEIRRVIDGLYSFLAIESDRGFSWAKNVQSVGKLREKWPKLIAELPKISGVAGASVPVRPDEKLVARAFADFSEGKQWTDPRSGVTMKPTDDPKYHGYVDPRKGD